jgi:ferredoxin-NADP reductase
LLCDIKSCNINVMFTTVPTLRAHRLLAAVGALTTPLLPEDYLGLANPLWSTTGMRGRVTELRVETDRATTIRIRPGRAWAGHTAGQFVRIGVDIDGVRQWRTYTLTSPEGARDLEITVQAQPGGAVSPYLAHSMPVGTIVHLEPAAGDFVLAEAPSRALLFVTGGSGITPAMAMLRTLADRGPLPDVVLVHSAPTPDQVIFREELRALASRDTGLRLVVRHTDTEGLLALTELDDICPDWVDREAYVCGPAGLLDAAEAHWAGAPDRLHVERFTPPARAAGGTGGTVAFGDTATVSVDGESSLLEAGEAAGVVMPSGCRMGICFGCVLPLRDGQVRDLRSGAVHGEPGDLIQTCISGASGAARLDVPTNS